MKIGLIGPGIMSIPPQGWGAVEILIWDYYNELKKQGINVKIINKLRKNHNETVNPNSNYIIELINEINNEKFDFVHLHYDVLCHILPKLNCKVKAITSHFPYIDNLKKHGGFRNIFNFMIHYQDAYNFVLAEKDKKAFIHNGANPEKVKKIKNGISSHLFSFTENPLFPNKTLYLGKIDNRKNQYLYQNLNNVDFVGPLCCNLFKNKTNYRGSWTREQVHKELTNYANLLLISKGEADPLVVKEALIAGLGVVVNFTSGQNLDEKPFITLIDDNKINDIEYVKEKIQENRKISINIREEIRAYGIEKFDISVETKNYINIIKNLV